MLILLSEINHSNLNSYLNLEVSPNLNSKIKTLSFISRPWAQEKTFGLSLKLNLQAKNGTTYFPLE